MPEVWSRVRALYARLYRLPSAAACVNHDVAAARRPLDSMLPSVRKRHPTRNVAHLPNRDGGLMPNTTHPDPETRDAARLFSYDEACPVCGKATHYQVVELHDCDGPGGRITKNRYVELQCSVCSWREVRC